MPGGIKLSDYELLRLENIRRNNQVMSELGLAKKDTAFMRSPKSPRTPKTFKDTKARKRRVASPREGDRRSKRVKGEVRQ